ncbi:efflux RND transporter permease subunit [Marinicella sp. S1101]|uniref:efflux RND transporter permease subunit n=1 Tax=Marinicella marina TaxID=2996016 RepID=UPI002260E963|nr:efflux RND transporter permease subunit [Marinicella marina]MCX7554195.1 efflux RND transporter permease subunit [Marinicella marina]MDJ1141112.1 efflux RND transporter permease subunit [Marinicella marina]
MLDKVIQFSLTQRLFLSVILGVFLVLGFYAWKQIPIDAFPDISTTQVNVIIKAPGMTAEEIESQITSVIETELLGIPNKDILRSTTKYAITSITIDFINKTDIYWARQQVNERLLSIWDQLPLGIEGGLAPMSSPLSEMFMFTIENPSLSLTERKHILDWQIRPLLRTVAGVADVNILGGETKTIQFEPDHIAMAHAQIGIDEVHNVIKSVNINGSVGRIDVGVESLIIRTEGRYQSIEDVAATVIKNDSGAIYRLKDLGEISYNSLVRYGAVTKDGEETAQALVVTLKNANTSSVIDAVQEKLRQIEMTLPEQTQLNVFYNRKNLIETAVGTITNALFQAIILVIVLLTIFLGNMRAALVVSTSIPIAVLITFFLMYQFGLSANLMSLGGLVIAIGMIVDSSVVVVENIVSQLSKNANLPRLHLMYRATKSIAAPVFSGTIIVIMVFVPLLSLTGLEGKLFSPVAVTIVFAMCAALVISLTVIPVLASLIIKNRVANTPKYLLRLQSSYAKTLENTLAAPMIPIIIFIILLVLSGLVYMFLGKTFMPVLDEGDIIVQLEKSPTISLEESVKLDQQIETALLSNVSEIKQIVARVGSDELGLDPMSLNETDVFMELRPKAEWQVSSKQEIEDKIREILIQYPGINFGFTQPIQMRVSEMLTGSSGAVTAKVFGSDVNLLAELAQNIADVVKITQGSQDVQTTLIEGGDFLNVKLKPELASEFNLSVSELSHYLNIQVNGFKAAEVINGKVKTPFMFSGIAKNGGISSIEGLKQIPLQMPDNTTLKLSDVAEVSLSQGPAVIEREDAERFAVVASNVVGRDMVGFVEELQKNIANDVSLPSGYYIEFGGEFENQIRATRNLMTVIPLVLFLIVLILFTTFKSLAKSSLIIVNIPFALMGGVFGLFFSGEYVSVPASIGFIALIGVSVLNGVVMLSHFESVKYKSLNLTRLISNAAGDRLRPILMTATTAMFGLMPLVAASGPGAEIQKPLAIVVIGGLFTSTLATLYLLPILYYKLEGITRE